MATPRSVLIKHSEHAHLMALLDKADPDGESLLFDELDAATIVADGEELSDVVTMGAEVTFLDVDAGESTVMRLVYPDAADPSRHHVSVLAPVGAALIGLRKGEEIDWPVPGGKLRRLRVTDVRHAGAGAGS
ncbi:MAG: nucleoside diphosphate kinase regulator [Halioglobus sp.]|nr:nucleoside diphosphate kinase regulator [Halioglobus sp.]|tara:strand:+ start:3050 stop:3445 length:396 start_codon:yes stop_codon:yes gene_type:complete